MSGDFLKPDFKKRSIETQYRNGEVNIYASKKGLEKLIEFANKLLGKPSIGHIHLEDYEVLTKESLITTIALFDDQDE